MPNYFIYLEQEIKALEKEKEYFKDWCKVYESRIETKDHIINQLETIIDKAKEYINKETSPEYRNGRANEVYLELNENKLKELLKILERGKE